MRNKLKLLLLCLTALPLSAQSVFYLSPRVSALTISGNPDIGDIGRKVDDNLPTTAYELIAGWEVTPRFNLELRYTGFATIAVEKISPTWAIFPGGEVTLPVERSYRFRQRTTLLSAAVPFRVLERGAWSVRLTPLLHLEWAEVELQNSDRVPWPPNITVPTGATFFSHDETNVNVGAEVSVNYDFSDRSFASLHYTYFNLSNFDAHQFGAGWGVRF